MVAAEPGVRTPSPVAELEGRSGVTLRRTVGRYRRSIASQTLCAAQIAVLLVGSWALAHFLGGADAFAPHWFYVPVILAGLRFGPVGSAVVAVLATALAGPLLPADVALGTPQAVGDWVSRGAFFLLLGQFVAQLFRRVRIGAERESQLVRAEQIQTVRTQAISESEQRFRALVQRAGEMVTVVGEGGLVAYESPASHRLLGFGVDDRIGQHLGDLVHPDDRSHFDRVMAGVVEELGRSATLEFRQRDAEGGWHWTEAIATNLLDEPTVRGVVINSRIVDERKRFEDELSHRALHDALTGLANRSLFRNHLDTAISRRAVGQRRPAVLFIDVDDFKTVNDGFGHDVGDNLLIAVADRLRSCTRREDIVARLGGDEFAVLLEEADATGAASAKVTEHILAAMQEPFVMAERTVYVTVSIGLARYTAATCDSDLLLRHADIAMYTAKAAGKGRCEVFSESMHEVIHRRLDVECALREAIAEGQIRVFYQPIVQLPTGAVDGVEALVRWEHPQRGLIPPADFLPVAEQSGLMIPIGRIVLNDACLQLKHWQTLGAVGQRMTVSVNLSSMELRGPTVVDDVRSAIENAGIAPGSLTIEVTETVLTGDVDRVAAVLVRLRALGVRIAIDDFGTGYSSLSNLQRFPVDVLKIDRAFVSGICGGDQQAALARAVIGLGEAFGLVTVGEGVEEAEQGESLHRLGCTQAQGYHYARPMRAEQIDALLSGPTAEAADGMAEGATAEIFLISARA